MRKSKKAQTAMEFLLTYGWAILVVLAIISVFLLYIMPRISTPNVCDVRGKVDCVDISYDDVNGVTVLFKNIYSTSIIPQSGKFVASTDTEFAGIECDLFYDGGLLRAGEGSSMSGSCSGGIELKSGDSVLGSLTIVYRIPGFGETDIRDTGTARFRVP
ncbi:hypothetical protein DRJ17_02905 [Candidatus Woesearchaeota archaeon]|nr:MAG: hypothetical protein DRJ17_02905 [Candidatus Woesearchaeota archaeon]